MSLCFVWFLAVFYYTGQSNAFDILPSCLFRSVSCFSPFNQRWSNFLIWESTQSFCFLWNSHGQSCRPQEKPDRHLQLFVILITDASIFHFFCSALFSSCLRFFWSKCFLSCAVTWMSPSPSTLQQWMFCDPQTVQPLQFDLDLSTCLLVSYHRREPGRFYDRRGTP